MNDSVPRPTANEDPTARWPLRQDAMMSSIVSYPKRAPWGDWSYRGNCDGQLFMQLVLRYGASSVADPMMGSGTTRDAIAALNEARRIRPQIAEALGVDGSTGSERSVSRPVRYWGADLRGGFDLATQRLPGKFDLVWVHPPYWSIIGYSDDARDLSADTNYETFRARLATCLAHCADGVAENGHLAVLVGDVRRAGRYYPIVRDVLNLEARLGVVRSIIIKAQHNGQSDKKQYGRMRDVPIKHEYCVVFGARAGVGASLGGSSHA